MSVPRWPKIAWRAWLDKPPFGLTIAGITQKDGHLYELCLPLGLTLRGESEILSPHLKAKRLIRDMLSKDLTL